MTIVVCAIVKHEDAYLDEWIAYHLKLGFDAVHLYDNSDDNAAKKFQERYPGAVRVVHCPGRMRQLPTYMHYCCFSKDEWVALLDADEFIVLKKHASIRELLAGVGDDVGAVCLNWYMFGSSGERARRPGPVLLRFRRRAARVHPLVKSIVRPDRVLAMLNPHVPALVVGGCRDPSGRPVSGPEHHHGSADVAVIHHYFTKSREEFVAKMERGKADLAEKRRIEEFDAHDFNDVEDDSAWRFFSAGTLTTGTR